MIETDEILFWYDGPLLFTRNQDGQKLLMSWADENPDLWLTVPITEQTLLDLKESKIHLREAFINAWVQDENGNKFETKPEHYPEEGCYLYG